MRTIFNFFLAMTLLGLGMQDAMAGRRSVRIDFGAWSDEFPLGSVDCPGSSPGSDTVIWNGFDFIGSTGNSYNVYEYCQAVATYEESLGTDEYLNENLFFDDESGLAAKVGENQDEPFITARRYTFLDGELFEDETDGFQWAFYFFPNGITLVTIYGEIPIDGAKFDPWIVKDGEAIWDSLESGYDGEYFCFEGNKFIGFWDGSNVGSNPSAGCILPPPPELVFANGFEDEEPE
jgi:hypothetical protein